MVINLRTILLSENPADILRRIDANGDLALFEKTLDDLKLHNFHKNETKDTLEHSFKVLENAIALEDNGVDLVLRTAALLHDIGKPPTAKRVPGRGVTFDAHEVVGARMIPKILKRHGFNKDEIAQVKKIVRLHMRSHAFARNNTTDSASRRIFNDAGDKNTFDKLVKVFYSDVTTANHSKKARIHKNLDRFVAEFEKVQKKDELKARRPAIDGNKVMEITGLEPGPELGKIMKRLYEEDMITADEETLITEVERLSSSN